MLPTIFTPGTDVVFRDLGGRERVMTIESVYEAADDRIGWWVVLLDVWTGDTHGWAAHVLADRIVPDSL